MNKIFKVIWNQATQSWVAVSELQKAKGKAASKTDKRVVVGTVAALTALTAMSGAYAATATQATTTNGVGIQSTVVSDTGAVTGTFPVHIQTTNDTVVIGQGADGSMLPNGSTTITGGIRAVVIGANATLGDPNTISGAAGSVVIGYNAKGQTANAALAGHVNYNNPHNTLSNQPGVTSIPTATNQVIAKDGERVRAGVISIGQSTEAQSGAVAIGDQAFAGRDETRPAAEQRSLGIALGAYAHSYNGGVAIGSATLAKGTNSFALGRQAAAIGDAAQAFGSASAAVGRGSTAIGHSAEALGNRSIAFGASSSNEQFDRTSNVVATADDSVAIGTRSATRTGATSSVVLGHEAEAAENALKSAAIGYNATTSAQNAVAIGSESKASNNSTVAIGDTANASGVNAFAMGTRANASTESAYAIGTDAVANNTKSIAIGSESKSSGDKSISIGDRANASNFHAIAVGTASQASGNTSMAIGDQANATSLYSFAAGGLANATANYTTAIGANANATGEFSTALGKSATATGRMGTALGINTNATGPNATAVGSNATAMGAGGLAMGLNATAGSATFNNAISIGTNSSSVAHSSIATGTNATASANNAIATGTDSKAQQQGSIAIGQNATSSNIHALALGTNATANLDRSVALGAYSTVSAAVQNPNDTFNGITYNFAGGAPAQGDVVSVGSADRKRQIQNVAAGQISGTSTDAINGSQLYSVITESHWKLQANGAQVGDVNFGDKVNFKSTDGSVTITPTAEANGVSTLDLQIKRGLGITLNNDGALGVANTRLDQSATTMRFSTPTGQQNSFVKADDLARHLNDVGFRLSGEAQAGTFEDLTTSSTQKQLRTGDTLTMIAGPNIKINQVNKGYEFSVEGENVAYAGNKATVPTIDEGYVATVKSVAEAINHSGFTLKTSAVAGGEKVSGTDEVINPADIVDMTAGKNLTVKQDANGKITYATKENVEFTNVNTTSLTAGPVTINNNGVDMGDTKITDLQDGTEDSDAVNVKQLKAAKETVVSTDGTVKVTSTRTNADGGKEFDLSVSFTDTDTSASVSAASTALSVSKGDTTKVNGVDVTDYKVDLSAETKTQLKKEETVKAGTNIVSVTEGTNASGAKEFTVNAKGTTASAGSDKVKVTAGTADANNVTDYAVDLSDTAKESLNKADTAVQSFTTAVKGATVDTINQQNTVINFVDGVGTTATIKDNDITFDVKKADLTTNPAGTVTNNNAGDTFVTGDDVADAINKATELTEKTTTVVEGSNTHVKSNVVGNNTEYTVSADKSTVSVSSALTKTETPTTDANGAVTTDYALDLSQTTKDDIKKGVDAKDIVDNKGLTFTGDSGSTNVEKLGSTVAVNGDKNITTEAAGDAITIKLKDDITVNSVTANTTTTNNLKVNPNGNVDMGGNKITNVAAGTNATDAVNVSQLQSQVAASKEVVKSTDKSVTVDDTQVTADGAKIFDLSVNVDSTTITKGENGELKANTTTLADAEQDGKVDELQGDDAKKLVNAGDIANAINNSGWKAKSGGNKAAGDQADETLINPSEVVEFNAGNNLEVKRVGNVFTFATKDDVTFNKVTSNAISVPTGTTPADKPITINNNGIDMADKPITNVAGNLDGAKTGTTAPTTSGTTPADVNNNNAATVGDVLNAGWNLQNNSEAKDFVKAYDVVNFIDGKGTKAVVEVKDNGTIVDVKFDTDTATITTNNDGSVTGPVSTQLQDDLKKAQDELAALPNTATEEEKKAAEDKVKAAQNAVNNANNALVTAQNVVDAINKSGFKLTATKSTGEVEGTTEELINPSDLVTIDAGDNIKLSQANGKITVATKKDVTFSSITVDGGNVNNQNPIKIGYNDAGNSVISNLTTHLPNNDGKKAGAAPNNVSDSNKSEAATLGDVLNAGWNLQVTGNPASTPTDVDFVSPYDTVNFKAGTGVLLGQASDGKTSTITISLAGDNGALRASDGSSLTGNPLGRIEVVENPTGMVNAGNVANMINKSGFSTTATLVMPNGDRFEGEESLINPGDQVNYVDGKNTKANVTVEKVAVPVTTFWVTETVNGKDQKVQVEPTKVDANGEVIEAVYAAGSSKAGQPVDLTSANKLTVQREIDRIEQDKFDVSYDVVTGETEVPVTGDNKGKAAVTGTEPANTALQAAKDELETAKQGGDQTAIDAAQAKVDAAQKAVDGINNAVATVGDIVETINNVAWYTNSTTATGDAADTAIKAGGRVNLEAGKNIEVTQTVDAATNTVSYTYSTKEEVDFNKITVSNGDNLVDGEGNKVTAEKDPVTGNTVYKNEAGDVVNAANVKPANTVNLANEAGKAVTNAATGQDASKPAPGALNITGTDAAGNASPTQITGVASTLNTKAVETSPAGKDQPKGSDNLVDLKGDANNPVNPTSAATVGDLQNMGWVVSAEGNGYKDTVKNANEVKFVGEGRVNVTGETKDGVREIKVAIKDQVVDGTERKNDVVNYDNGSNTVANVNDVYNYKPSDTEPAQELTKKADGNYYDKAGNVVNNVDQNKLTPVGYAVSYDVVTGETEVPVTGDNKGKAAVTGAEPANTALQAAKDELETAKQGGDQTAIDAAQAKVDAAQKAVDGINNAVATVGDIIETINNVAWYTNSTTATGGAADTAIKAGGRVNLEAGKNIEVTQTVDAATNTVSYTYSTKEEVDFNKITVSNGDNLVDGEGNKVTAEKDPVTGETVYKNEAGDVVNAANVKPANTVNLANEAGKAVTNAATGQDASKPAPGALNITGTDAAGNASPTQITGVASTLNTKAVETSPAGKDQPKGSDNLVDLKGDANNPVNPTSAATVGDLQNMGWVVSASGNEYKDTVKNANEVKFVGTNLAKVTGETDGQGVRTITVDVNTQNVVENAQLPVVYTNAQGDKIYKQVDAQGNVTFNTKPDGTGDVVQPGDVIASMNSGGNSTVAPTTLANVKSNLAPVTAANEKQPDANSLTNLEVKKNNAATVEDVLSAGWNLQNNGTAVDTVTHNDTVNFVDGRATTVSVEANEDGTINNIKVDVETDEKTITVKDGNLAAVTTTLADTNNDGKIDAPINGDSLVNATTVANAINNSGFMATASGNTVGTTKNQLIKAGETVTLDAGKNLAVTQTDGKFSFATKDDVNFNSVQFGDIGPKITNNGGNINVGDKDGNATKITNVANGTDNNDAVNFSQLKASKEVVKSDDKSITVETSQNEDGANVFDVSVNVDGTTITKDPATGTIKANTANLNVANEGNIDLPTNGDENKLITAGEVAQTVNNISWKVDSAKDETTANAATKNTYTAGNNKVKAGDTVKVNAGRNVEISGSGKDINVAVSDNPEFNTVKVGKGNNATTISSDADGVRIAKADGSPQRITNVAAGRADSDAVNVSQLKGAVNNLNNKINRNSREARAGIAGSNAAASLPQVYIPGKSMVAAAAGTFKGENALAVGYSRASDNGKLILKLQGNANSRGDIGGGVGVGYQW